MDERPLPDQAESAPRVVVVPVFEVAILVLQGIAAAAGIIASVKSIFEDHGKINDKLDEILTELQQLRQELIRATADILEAIHGIHRALNQQKARDNITLANTALFNDLAIFDDKQEAMSNSFQAADRLVQEDDPSFAASFMYVVNIRLAVLKEFDPNYFCIQQFIDEFRRYIARLAQLIEEIKRLIRRSHTVSVEQVLTIEQDGSRWQGNHFRGETLVASFKGPQVTCRRTLAGVANRPPSNHAWLGSKRTAGIWASWTWRTPSKHGGRTSTPTDAWRS